MIFWGFESSENLLILVKEIKSPKNLSGEFFLILFYFNLFSKSNESNIDTYSESSFKRILFNIVFLFKLNSTADFDIDENFFQENYSIKTIIHGRPKNGFNLTKLSPVNSMT